VTVQISIISTGKCTELDGVTVQLWQGRDMLGRKCDVLVMGIQTSNEGLARDLAVLFRENVVIRADMKTGEVLSIDAPLAPSGLVDQPLAEGVSPRVEGRAEGTVDFQAWLEAKAEECRAEGTRTTPPALPGQETDTFGDSGG